MKDASPELQRYFRRVLLEQEREHNLLDDDELVLFEWYARKRASTYEQMHTEVDAYIREQKDAGLDDNDMNDSGLVAIDYYVSRARHADIVYLASLLEVYLSRASVKLARVLGDHNVVFQPDELQGSKWERHKKFLERYGAFKFPSDVWGTLNRLISIRNDIVHEKSETQIGEADISQWLAAFRALVEHINKQITAKIDRSLRPEGLKGGHHG